MKYFIPEDGGNMFLQNVCIHFNLTQYQNPEVPYPKNPHSRKKDTTRDITVFHLTGVRFCRTTAFLSISNPGRAVWRSVSRWELYIVSSWSIVWRKYSPNFTDHTPR